MRLERYDIWISDTPPGYTSPPEVHIDVNLAVHGPWIGCDPSVHNDDPYDIQGEWYIEGDEHGSCASEEVDCSASGCRFSGTTVVDDDRTAWGCRVELSLKVEPGADEGEWVKLPYDGRYDCFEVVIIGNSGGADVHLSVGQIKA